MQDNGTFNEKNLNAILEIQCQTLNYNIVVARLNDIQYRWSYEYLYQLRYQQQLVDTIPKKLSRKKYFFILLHFGTLLFGKQDKAFNVLRP